MIAASRLYQYVRRIHALIRFELPIFKGMSYTVWYKYFRPVLVKIAVGYRGVMDRPVNVFVLGLDEHNRRILESMRGAHQYRFHGVLTYREIYREHVSFARVLSDAQQILDNFDGPIDAIIGFWDFPVSSVVQLLRKRYGLSPSGLKDVVMCEHKYWSRRIQEQVISEYPRFALVDPQHDGGPPAELSFPMWIKPVKSFASMLAFGVKDRDEYDRALAKIRKGIGRMGEPFDVLLRYVDLPDEIAEAGGQVCIAEEAISGKQVTVEGYRYRGEVVIYGMSDSVRYEHSPSFLRYQYPSTIPENVQDRLRTLSRKVVEAIGLERMTFNIEFFWDADTDEVVLLEINPRHSQSHAELFADVDGITNHEILLHLAQDKEPEFPRGGGPNEVAATWFIRRFSDGVVRRRPSSEEVIDIERTVPHTTIELIAQTGDRLSHMHGQDSYSYRLATVFIGAGSQEELTAKFDHVVSALQYEVDDVEPEVSETAYPGAS